MAVGDGGPAALAPWRAAEQAGHLGAGASLVDEEQPGGVEVVLPVEPGVPRLVYVRPLLLGGMRRLFLRVMPWRAKKRCTTLGSGR